MTDGPRPDAARERYDSVAPRYDLVTALLRRARRRAVERLDLRPGQVVLDVACGTGLNFDALREGVGPEGRLVGIDLSAGMLEVARRRVSARGWANVQVIHGDVTEADLPPGDAALFSFTHDVLRLRPAVEAVVAAVRPGGRVASAGVKYAPRAALPVNAAVRLVAPRFITTLEGLDAPWSHLEEVAGPLDVESMLLGSMYVSSGTVHRGG